MKFWQTRTSTYFNIVACVFLFGMVIALLFDSVQSLQTRQSLKGYMEQLRDMVFMSTYDSLKKGNMNLFRKHMEEIGTFDDVREFSLLDIQGVVQYSSRPELVQKIDAEVIDMNHPTSLPLDGFTTYYFPVETNHYCSRCHIEWKIGSINSFYKLTLSSRAIEQLKTSTHYYHGLIAFGGLIFLVLVFVITLIYERKKQEERDLVSDSVRNFMNAVDDPFLSVDASGICTFCNRTGLDLFGYEEESELVGRNLQQAVQHTREDGKTVSPEEGLLYMMFDAGKSTVVNETILWRADGSHFVAECRLHPIIRNGEISGATISFLDITQKKAEELRTMHLSHLASLGELTAGVAHEINNPISGVINYAQLYKNRYETDEAGKELLDRIIKEGKRIASIVYSLLNYAHQGKERIETLNFIDVISETLNLFQARLDREGIVLDVDIAPEIPLIRGNFQNLEQVLMNLISNARYALNKKYPNGYDADKILRISLESIDDASWPHIRLTVFDHGTGIPKDIINKVMNPFITTKPAGEGTGLGLHVCLSIITQHQGRIMIDSVPDAYTKVSVALPTVDRKS